ncbi:VGFR1 factor, partial [Atractosteus spatula]|nr:VGFR1 factor [Atractosteus spatula]
VPRSKGRLSSPVLSVLGRQLVIEANQTLQLQCKGRSELSWAYPERVTVGRQKLNITGNRCGRGKELYCSTLTLVAAQAQSTGSYSCKYLRKRKRQATVYVYIKVEPSWCFLQSHMVSPSSGVSSSRTREPALSYSSACLYLACRFQQNFPRTAFLSALAARFLRLGELAGSGEEPSGHTELKRDCLCLPTRLLSSSSSGLLMLRYSSRPFVELHSENPEVVYMTEGSGLIIPCRVTAPDITVSLNKFPAERLVPDGKSVIWNSKQGFIIPAPTYRNIGLFSCETVAKGVLYSTKYLTHRQVNKIIDVYLNATSPLRMLHGDRLALNCTVTAEWNARVVFTWSYPGKANNSATITKRMIQGSANVFYSLLVIDQLRSSDGGLYRCQVQSGPSSRQTNTTLVVYGFEDPEDFEDLIPATSTCCKTKLRTHTHTGLPIQAQNLGPWPLLLLLILVLKCANFVIFSLFNFFVLLQVALRTLSGEESRVMKPVQRWGLLGGHDCPSLHHASPHLQTRNRAFTLPSLCCPLCLVLPVPFHATVSFYIDKKKWQVPLTPPPAATLAYHPEKPFINLKYRHGPVVEVTAGQKSYRLSSKLRAFPFPEVIWLKDGKIAAEQCSRYRVDGNSLVIRDVSEEDAGVYTILVGIQQYSLYSNLTVSLVVNVKPQIGEKAVSQDPGTYARGSRQTLLCTAYAFPPPQIQWLWHPCPKNSMKGLCKLPPLTKRTRVQVTTNATNIENWVSSISQRSEVFEGRNKTVGLLVVEQSLVSGVYRCVASNKIGTDRRDISFFVTDVPNGFSVEMEESPTEGAELRLACTANRFLYAGVTWHLPTHTGPRALAAGGNRSRLALGEYSNTLHLRLANITQEHSGTYTCTARRRHTGETARLEQRVDVIAHQAPQLLGNLSSQVVNVSSAITLTCLAQGVPKPQLVWYKDNQELHQGSGILLSTGGSTLHIERITQEDEGWYTCEATNERGSVESSAYITVQAVYHSGVLALTGSADLTEKSNLEIPTLTCTCIVATLFWLLLTLFIRKLKRPSRPEIKTDCLSIIMDPGEVPLDEQCERLPYDASKWEFPRERLKLEKPLGRGAFGKVMQASAFGINKSSTCRTVAVKMLKEGATASEYKALMTELKILIHIGHHLNVVNLLGACTKYGGPLMVIVEYCKNGNLSSYLKSKREVFILHKDGRGAAPMGPQGEEEEGQARASSSQSSTSSGFEEEERNLNDTAEEEQGSDAFYNKPIAMEDLISYSFQVARGMEFLASRKVRFRFLQLIMTDVESRVHLAVRQGYRECIHRDLAARNILLSENNVVKICDFGLARDIYKDPDYVRKGDARLPLKWMSPESIFDKVYTTQSDVWSYGVLLWEIFSLGASPYPGVQIDEEFCTKLKEGTRMRAPGYATPEIYDTMLACWETDPKERPTFSELVETLGDLLQANVQQDGKDYIPLNTVPSPNSGSQRYSSSSTDLSAGEDAQQPRFSYQSTGSLGYINTRRTQSVKTFDELSVKDRTFSDDYQTDSGMVLPSEELQALRWSSGKTRPLSSSCGFRAVSKSRESVPSAVVRPSVYSASCGHQGDDLPIFSCGSDYEEPCCSTPPPDYNSAVFYPPL